MACASHAILQANLFLGLGLDAYIAIGRLPGGIVQHVWVLTREPSGDVLLWETASTMHPVHAYTHVHPHVHGTSTQVLFWETTKGSYYRLPRRWTGLYLEGAADVALFRSAQGEMLGGGAAAGAGAGSTRGGGTLSTREAGGGVTGRGGGGGKRALGRGELASMSREERRSARAAAALAKDKAEREAARKAKELAERQKQEGELLEHAPHACIHTCILSCVWHVHGMEAGGRALCQLH